MLINTVEWDQLCNNSAIFNKIFATEVLGSRAAKFQAQVCSSVSLQTLLTRDWMKTLENVDGLGNLIKSVSYRLSHIIIVHS